MLHFQNNTKGDFEKTKIISALETVVCKLNIPDQEFTLVLEKDQEMRKINYQYRKINQSTDVLSFHQGNINPETGKTYLGDIVISLKKAIDQANEKSLSVNNAVLYLAIHGLLHLMGYDHSTPEEESEMFELQERLFKEELIYE